MAQIIRDPALELAARELRELIAKDQIPDALKRLEKEEVDRGIILQSAFLCAMIREGHAHLARRYLEQQDEPIFAAQGWILFVIHRAHPRLGDVLTAIRYINRIIVQEIRYELLEILALIFYEFLLEVPEVADRMIQNLEEPGDQAYVRALLSEKRHPA